MKSRWALINGNKSVTLGYYLRINSLVMAIGGVHFKYGVKKTTMRYMYFNDICNIINYVTTLMSNY